MDKKSNVPQWLAPEPDPRSLMQLCARLEAGPRLLNFILVFVGLSSTARYLHLPDHTDFLLYDMLPMHPEPDQT
jgi:hypothetical protein